MIRPCFRGWDTWRFYVNKQWLLHNGPRSTIRHQVWSVTSIASKVCHRQSFRLSRVMAYQTSVCTNTESRVSSACSKPCDLTKVPGQCLQTITTSFVITSDRCRSITMHPCLFTNNHHVVCHHIRQMSLNHHANPFITDPTWRRTTHGDHYVTGLVPGAGESDSLVNEWYPQGLQISLHIRSPGLQDCSEVWNLKIFRWGWGGGVFWVTWNLDLGKKTKVFNFLEGGILGHLIFGTLWQFSLGGGFWDTSDLDSLTIFIGGGILGHFGFGLSGNFHWGGGYSVGFGPKFSTTPAGSCITDSLSHTTYVETNEAITSDLHIVVLCFIIT